ncbi:hypothetical protein Tco_0916501 [Tanacetum coccineum]
MSARIDSSDDEASLGDQEDASKQGRKIHDIDVDEDITPGKISIPEQASTLITSSKDKGKGSQLVASATLQVKKNDLSTLLIATQEAFKATSLILHRTEPSGFKRQEEAICCINCTMELIFRNKMRLTLPHSYTLGSKRAGDELEQEPLKKQKVDDDKETEELKQCMEIISDDGDDVTIEVTPLSTKSLTIMLKNFDREDLEVLWSIVKARFKKTKPVNYMDIFLHLNLKTMFEHHLKVSVWKNQQGLVKVLNWKLYDSCRVHCVTMQNILYYLLVKKMYPLTKHTLHQMFIDVKLQVDYECKMAFELLRLVKKQLKEGHVPQ